MPFEVHGEDDGEVLTHILAAKWILEDMESNGRALKESLRAYSQRFVIPFLSNNQKTSWLSLGNSYFYGRRPKVYERQYTARNTSAFFQYFEEKGHKVVPSVPLVVKDDPTLMFINANESI